MDNSRKNIIVNDCTFSLAWITSNEYNQKSYNVVLRIDFINNHTNYLCFNFLSLEFMYTSLKQIANAYNLDSIDKLYDVKLSAKITTCKHFINPYIIFYEFKLNNDSIWPYKNSPGHFLQEKF